MCLCNKDLYQVRPFTYELLRSIQPFFELIAFSKMPFHQLEQIIEFMELILNKPIIDMLLDKNRKKKRRTIRNKKKRTKIEVKSFFQNIVCEMGFVSLPEVDDHLHNLFLLTQNRNIPDIFLITSNQFGILTAMEHGFCAIPVIKFQSFMQSDF